jgi:hypothetical protein
MRHRYPAGRLPGPLRAGAASAVAGDFPVRQAELRRPHRHHPGDGYTDQTNPANNYGADTALRVDGSPLKYSYLRFNVAGIRGTVTRATLRSYADSSGSDLHAYALASHDWQESTLTWNTAPAFGPEVGSARPVTGGTWVDIDVTSMVQADGIHEFGLATTGSTQIHLSSARTPATLHRSSWRPPADVRVSYVSTLIFMTTR